MELKLVKMYRHGEDDSMAHLSIEASYGYGGKMCSDIIQINYNGKKREAFIAARVLNPGAGAVIERMIEAITTVDYAAPKVKNPPLLMLEVLAERLNLRYDSDEAARAL
ncbi:MAG TPA: hypothetical protein PLM53_07285 [Spirochaetota bacterium]|nr:hypothetical protein [Spirochaetota bacterium]HPC42702.1 hypothetical protein [Spirochaetota bacterium]HPL15771.1 hypothetical protein [Spirochaetota bacterium]HQF07829.1 hypothetical protein [Spirochaetota bacterium]HQH96882.1 hypothetical protein [Spirochaetota bacterium]